MNDEYSFPRYLLSKQSVDDRAINKDVFSALKSALPKRNLRVIEVGGGIGTMIKRLVQWDALQKAEYILVDESAENMGYAAEWLSAWAKETGLSAERTAENQIRIFDSLRDIRVQYHQADVFDFIRKNETQADLLIAHAFLDLLPMPESLHELFKLTKSLAWFTLNFDGVTTLVPVLDTELDKKIEALYHRTMDERKTGGDSKSGRNLFANFKHAGAEILSAGSSDWVVYGTNGEYPQDETYFLNFILHFFEESLKGHAELDELEFLKWLKERRGQIKRGELTYIAHQLDFLVKK